MSTYDPTYVRCVTREAEELKATCDAGGEVLRRAPSRCGALTLATGSAALGDVCLFESQCRAPLACAFTEATCAAGTCVDRRECLADADCEEVGGVCRDGACLSPAVAEGGACDGSFASCEEGLWCVYGEDGEGRCAVERQAGVGEPCDLMGVGCAAGLTCGESGVCLAPAGRGEACEMSLGEVDLGNLGSVYIRFYSSSCAAGLWCVGGVCSSDVPAANDPCVDFCPPGLACVDVCAEEGCADYRCAPSAYPGQACFGTAQCAHGACGDDGVCVVRGLWSVEENLAPTCVSGEDCGEGVACVEGRCDVDSTSFVGGTCR